MQLQACAKQAVAAHGVFRTRRRQRARATIALFLSSPHLQILAFNIDTLNLRVGGWKASFPLKSRRQGRWAAITLPTGCMLDSCGCEHWGCAFLPAAVL